MSMDTEQWKDRARRRSCARTTSIRGGVNPGECVPKISLYPAMLQMAVKSNITSIYLHLMRLFKIFVCGTQA
jgi:hypothetical protein